MRETERERINVAEEQQYSAARGSDRGPRLGRPPKPAETVRSERVVTFVTPTELEALQRLAERWNSSVSGTVYRFVIQTLEAESNNPKETTGRTS